MLEELFILNERGDTLIAKRYFILPPTSTTMIGIMNTREDMHCALFRMIHSGSIDRGYSPTSSAVYLGMWELNVTIIHRSNLFICVAHPTDTHTEALDFLETLHSLLQDVIGGVLDEVILLDNSVLVQEVVEEMVFLGTPICMSSAALKKDLILSTPIHIPPLQTHKSSLLWSSFTTIAATPFSGIHADNSTVLQMSLQVLEVLNATYDVSCRRVSSRVYGQIHFKSTNLHLQEISVSLSLHESNTKSTLYDSALFDERVDIPLFDQHQRLRFKANEDNFCIMQYSIFLEPTPPFNATVSLKRNKTDDQRCSIFIIIRTNFSSDLLAKDVSIQSSIPKSAENVTCEVHGMSDATKRFECKYGEHRIIHALPDICGSSDLSVRYKMRIATGYDATLFGPIELQYSIPDLSYTSLRVSHIALSSDGIGSNIEHDQVARSVIYTSRGTLTLALN
jgi:hypothetical protein